MRGSMIPATGFLRVLFFLLPWWLTACGGNDVAQIEWMIPMQPSQDQHSTSSLDGEVPTWAVHRGMAADLMLLHKRQARHWRYHVTEENPLHRDALRIELLGVSQHLRIGPDGYFEDEAIDNPAAYVRILKQGHTVYQGWLYQNFPELFGLDDPDWQVWLRGVQLPTQARSAS